MPPKRDTRYTKDDVFAARIRALEDRVDALTKTKVPTVPTYDSANFPANAVEGQVVIADIGGGGAASGWTLGQEQVAGSPSSTVLNGATTNLNWSHSTGDALLDYSNTTKPTVIHDGLYSITVNINTTTLPVGNWSVEFRVGEAGTAPIMYFITGTFKPMPAFSQNTLWCPLWKLPAGGELNLFVNNTSGGSLVFELDTSYVQAILI